MERCSGIVLEKVGKVFTIYVFDYVFFLNIVL